MTARPLAVAGHAAASPYGGCNRRTPKANRNMASSDSDRKNKVFYGWWIALVLSILSTYGNGIYYYGFSTFVKPIVQELAWSMTWLREERLESSWMALPV